MFEVTDLNIITSDNENVVDNKPHNDLLEQNGITSVSYVSVGDVETITKFKYRKTKPKYPKPGAFYWIEETIDGKPKYGLYFVSNEKDEKGNYFLIRLDSKVYEMVVQDEDGYIRITDKDVFDKQEIYLIIGKYEKEDDTFDDGTPNGKRVFRITKKENKGLATVEATVEYVSDSNNMLYMSNVKDEYWTGVRLGDIREGNNKETLKNKTISDILDLIIYPSLQPIVTEPSVEFDFKTFVENECGDKIRWISDNHVLVEYSSEIINNFDKTTIMEYASYDRGSLVFPTVIKEHQYQGEYAGEFKGYIIDDDIVKIDSPIGCRYVIIVSAEFEDGEQPLDSKGNPARYDDKIDNCVKDGEPCEGCDDCLIPQFKSKIVNSEKYIVDFVRPICTNAYELDNSEMGDIRNNDMSTHLLLDYLGDEPGEIFVECPREYDGYDPYKPYNFAVDYPNGMRLEVYQYNEFTKDYDIKLSDTSSAAIGGINVNNMSYNRYIRGFEDGVKTKETDTNTIPVKYKIEVSK